MSVPRTNDAVDRFHRGPSGGRTMVAACAITALLAAAVSTWAPQVLHRSDAAPAAHQAGTAGRVDAGVAQAERRGINVAGVVQRASHQAHLVAGRPGELRVSADRYGAAFDAHGFAYTPTDASTPFSLSFAGLGRGSAALPVERGPWTAKGQVATRSVSAGVHEQVTARAGEMEWDVVLGSEPAGSGDLRVTADLGDSVGQARLVHTAGGSVWEFALVGGGTVRMDALVVVDATGRTVYRGMPEVSGSRLSLAVPARVLAGASYPLTLDPTVSSPTTVGAGFNPSVAFDGTNYLVVWQQGSGTNQDIYGARVSGTGSFLSGPFIISTAAQPETHPDVAWNGSRFLVVWELQNTDASPLNDYDVRAQFLSSAGGFIGSNFLVYGPRSSAQRYDERHPAVAANGVNFMVVWEDNFNAPTLGIDVYYKTISGSGAVGFAQPVANTTHSESSPDVAWNGASYLVVYGYTFSSTDYDVYGQRINPNTGDPRLVLSDGTPNGGLLGGNFPIRNPGGYQTGPAVASENSNPWAGNGPDTGGPFLVAWNEQTSDADVYGSLVQPTGASESVGSLIVITNRVKDESLFDLTYNGAYFAAWIVFNELPGGGYSYDVMGGRISRTGTVQDAGGIPVAADANSSETSPAVTNGKGGEWGVAYNINGTIALRHVAPK